MFNLFKPQTRNDFIKDIVEGIVSRLKEINLSPKEMTKVHDDTKKEFYRILLEQRELLLCEIENSNRQLIEVNKALKLFKNEDKNPKTMSQLQRKL